MIFKVMEQVKAFKNKKINFRYNGSRNQVEEFEGIIINCYKYTFLIDTGVINRSFSYSDVLIGILEIDV
jgi:uncharacterized protein Veg